ncbi:MAG: hypothetical protein K9H64_10215 [Bacteroidales bacterium]|nr:hypothetical protein [Bacteroidales bacterium]MCF8456242.1 hypothetical protein [Bacteroidales bacterium]
MGKKIFYNDYEGKSILKGYKREYQGEILGIWNREVPQHVKNFNHYQEDRNAVIYFALFVEYHINQTIETLYPDFDYYLDLSKTATGFKINLLASFRLFPCQIFEACRCINNIRNEFAHEFKVVNLEQLNQLPDSRKKKTIDKLIRLTSDYKGDYTYEEHGDDQDTIRNRFKSLCMNTVTALRIFEPQVKRLRTEKIEK